nr:hypothetical protein [Carnobacterium sp.]
MNNCLLFKYVSVLTFSGAVFTLISQEFIIGYSLLFLGYYLLKISDKEK